MEFIQYFNLKEDIYMFCSKCGKSIPDNAIYCPECGNNTNPTSQQQSMGNIQNTYNNGQQIVNDEPNTLANIASCCFPIVGLVLYLVWKDTKPKSSSAVCKWAIGGVIAVAIIYILCIILGLAGSSFSSY